MNDSMGGSMPGGGWINRRIERKGLRPRLAASVIALLWLLAIVVFGVLERLVDPDAFESIWDGMWWATQTVTTVGYGDVVPEKGVGRLIGAVLMIGGLSLFAVVTGSITSAFVTRAQEQRRAPERDAYHAQLEQVSAELAAIRADLARLGGDESARPDP